MNVTKPLVRQYISKFSGYILGSVLSGVASLLSMTYTARVMDESDVGYIGLTNALLFIAPILLSFSSSGLLAINYTQKSKADYLSFRSTYMGFGMINLLIFSSVILLISIYFEFRIRELFLFPFIAYSYFLNDAVRAENVQKMNVRKVVFYSVFFSIASLVFLLLIEEILSLGWRSRIYSIALASIMSIILILRRESLSFNIRLTFIEYRQLLIFGGPLFLAGMAGWTLNQADKIIVERYLSVENLAMYSVAFSYASVLALVNTALSNVMVAKVYDYLSGKNRQYSFRSLVTIHVLIGTIASLLFLMFAELLIPVLFGESYSRSVTIARFIVTSFWLNGLYRAYGGVIVYYKETGIQLLLTIIAAVVNVLLSVYLITILEELGPAVATLLGNLLLFIMVVLFSSRLLKSNDV